MKKEALAKAPQGADFAIFFTTLVLLGIGLVMVFSASYITSLETRGDAFFFLRRQGFWVLLGLTGMFFLANFPYYRLRKFAPLLLVINFILLLAIFIPGLGVEVNEARRWLGFGGLTIQPAEFTKISLIIFTAAFLSRKANKIYDFWQTSFIPLLVLAISFGLILKQPDLGTALAIGATIALMLFAAGMPLGQFFGLGLLALPAVIYTVFAEEYRLRRLFSFLDPWEDPLGTGYHIIQSLYALAPGGLFGVGLGRSRQKLYYLPEPQNDFIFAIIGEELGFIGAVTVILLFHPHMAGL